MTPADVLLGRMGRGFCTRTALYCAILEHFPDLKPAQVLSILDEALPRFVKARMCGYDEKRKVYFVPADAKKKPPTGLQECHENSGKTEGFHKPIGPDQDGE